MVYKEIFIIVVCILYLLVIAIKNWGQVYDCIGIDEERYKRLITDPKSCEEKCRLIFESIFHVPFTKCRPDWLKNPKTKKNLELDGFNSKLPTPIGFGLAFEFNGPQHYHFTPKYHKNEMDFLEQQYRDDHKIEMCKQKKVILITIPYTIIEYEKYIMEKIYEHDLYHYVRK